MPSIGEIWYTGGTKKDELVTQGVHWHKKVKRIIVLPNRFATAMQAEMTVQSMTVESRLTLEYMLDNLPNERTAEVLQL